MKFQSVFIVFNVLLVVFILVLCLSPVLLLGTSMVSTFWKSSWYLIIILALLLVGFDWFYFTNRRLYALLEKEDWPALVQHLEDRVIRKGKYSPRLVRLLANTYLVLSDSPAVISLENKASMAKPSLLDDNALVFGTARILGKDIAGAAHFFETRLQSAKPASRPWVRWYYGFALLLDRQYEKAAGEFSFLAREAKDGVITGLSAYFLGNVIPKSLPGQKDALAEPAAEGRKRVKEALPACKNWAGETARINAEIHTAVLSRYMEEAGQWIYEPISG